MDLQNCAPWTVVRNVESKIPLQTRIIRMCVSMRPQGFMSTFAAPVHIPECLCAGILSVMEREVPTSMSPVGISFV